MPHFQLRFLTGLFSLLLCVGCQGSSLKLQGYVEGDYTYVASPLAGTLLKREVNRGAFVKTGQELFRLESELEIAAQGEAQARLAEASARLENLKKGKRPSEIAALEAKVAEAKSKHEMAKLELERVSQLSSSRAVSKRDSDQARTNFESSTAILQGLTADLTTAKLGAREDEIAAAIAEVGSLNQLLTQANWKVTQKVQRSIIDALVTDTFFEEGEWVPAGNPVLSLLAPEKIKLRFFVPEQALAQVSIGQKVTASIDGVAVPSEANVSFISPQAEFTPPVIFSKESRAKLVFMVEATFNNVQTLGEFRALKPGQPVDVQLQIQ